MDDKNVEQHRYDKHASKLIDNPNLKNNLSYYRCYLLSPYKLYYNYFTKNLSKNVNVLEVGGGTGVHTDILIESLAKVNVCDISDVSLKVLRSKWPNSQNLFTINSDIEKLPFNDCQFALFQFSERHLFIALTNHTL